MHAVVARSTFPSQNVQNTPRSDHFWKLRCRKSARRCGAKHISKSKYIKHHVRTTFRSCDVEKVHAVWREAHFEVKMLKTLGVRTTFGGSDVEKDPRWGSLAENHSPESKGFRPMTKGEAPIQLYINIYIYICDI